MNWRSIDFGNGRYEISDTGLVRNTNSGKMISTHTQNSGYKLAHLYSGGFRKAMLVHRLVAIAFLEKEHGKEKVDHIDSNKLNNHVTNLRWVTDTENMQHAVRSGRLAKAANKARYRMSTIGKCFGFANSQVNLKPAKPLSLIIDGIRRDFRSTRQASLFLKIDHKTLSNRIARGYYI